ncbi:MAG: glycosyltransferase [Microbacterium sp.]
MSARLRVVLDQLAEPAATELGEASRQLTAALIERAPSGCVVEGIAPRSANLQGLDLAKDQRYGKAHRDLVAAWARGRTLAAEGGLIHSPTLAAPLVKKNPALGVSQTVVTVWDLTAWQSPRALPRQQAAQQQALLARAEKYADAVVVPTHAAAQVLEERGEIGGRVRVIAGAAPAGFDVPSDEQARRRDAGVPAEYVTAAGTAAPIDALADAFAAAHAALIDIVVLDVPDGDAQAVRALAADAGLAPERLHLHGRLDRGDRAAILAQSRAHLAASNRTAWPWRAVEAMTVGTPVIALDTPVHREVVFEGGDLVQAAELGDALRTAIVAGSSRLGLLAHDRSRAFSWAGAAERTWALHAEL